MSFFTNCGLFSITPVVGSESLTMRTARKVAIRTNVTDLISSNDPVSTKCVTDRVRGDIRVRVMLAVEPFTFEHTSFRAPVVSILVSVITFFLRGD